MLVVLAALASCTIKPKTQVWLVLLFENDRQESQVPLFIAERTPDMRLSDVKRTWRGSLRGW